MKSAKQQKRKTTGKIRKWAIGGAVVVAIALIAGRVYLPYWLTGYVNEKIAALDGYGGSVKDIDIHLWRGAYQIHGLDIHKTQGGLKTPFVAAKLVDFSIEWKALWYGTIVSEADIENIAVTFSKTQTGEEADWAKFIDELTPFDINRVDVKGGKIAYRDDAAKPAINLYVENIQAQVTNLRNVHKRKEALPSDLRIRGRSIGDGDLTINGRGNILRNTPDFDLDLKLENASLTALNEYARDALGIDFVSGKIGIYSELAAADGRMTGYVTPIITEMKILGVKDDTNPLRVVWEGLVAAFMEVFKNHSQDQFALRIPIEGRIDAPRSNMWAGFWSIFSNAFAGAFPRMTDGSIDFKRALEESANTPSAPAKH